MSLPSPISQGSISIEDEIKKSYLEYSLSVIIGRAIPDVRDGLKPVHRRILFAMHELGNGWNRPYKKSARVVGDVIGKYHPHGDSAVYDALVRMAQDFSMRDPLVDGQGNFGSIDGDAAAAMRYTEVRMARLTSEFLADIDKATVNFRPNYDNTMEEPEVLPAKAPNLLLNGSAGIAVGMATNIPPHNLGELCDAVLHLIRDPDCDVMDLMEYVKGPDFPTRGTVYAGKGLYDAYLTGRGSIRIRGRVSIEERGKGKSSGLTSIVITEIPYALNKSSLVEKIAALVNDRKIENVSDLRDESDRRGIRVVLDLKKGAIPEIVVNALYKYTPLETSFGVNMLAVVGNRPMLLDLKKALAFFLEHRKDVVIRRTRFDLEKSEKRAHILEGLKIALDNIDEVVALIRASKTPQEAKERLQARFGLSPEQSQAILDMRLQRLTNLEREKLLEEYAELLKLIEYLKSILASEEVLLGVIRDETAALKETFASPRRTEIIADQGPGEIAEEDLIPDEDVVITLSKRGYMKRTSLENYQQQRRGGKGISGAQTATDDIITNFIATSNHQHLLLFTNRGKMHTLKVHHVPEGSRTAKGAHIANLLPLEKEEWIAAVLSLRDFSADRYLFFVTKKGMVKRTAIDQYKNVRSTGIKGLILKPGDELIMVAETELTDEIILASRKGMAIRFNSGDARPMGRGAAGVKGMALRPGDEVVGSVVVRADHRKELLTVAANGYGKRTDLDKYRLQSRGGFGVTNMNLTEKTGPVVGAIMVDPDDAVVLLTSGNKIIRIGVGGVSLVGRATQGVKLVDVGEGQVIGFDLVQGEEKNGVSESPEAPAESAPE